ncbi:cyclase family protein [Plantibacter sp. Mn2098]|uniref:cyclase family protein n=1 Tax=Plantibacter sp. Mn2098 TaxID=3395266 RepID=UPI003BD8E733
MIVDLSHTIRSGLVTYPGLPAPAIRPHLTREASRSIYAPGTDFAMDIIEMIGNTGTYLDSPFHRYRDGADLASLSLETLVDLPAVVVRLRDAHRRAIDINDLPRNIVSGSAVLFDTGWDRNFGTDAYPLDAPYLTAAAAAELAGRKIAIVGIDSINIDDISPASAGARPAHSTLLKHGIHVVEHLANLSSVPAEGARFTAAPPRIEGFGTFPVRAYAIIKD